MPKSFQEIIVVGLLCIGGFFSNLGQTAPLTAKPGDNLNAIANGMNSGDVLVLQDGTYTGGSFFNLSGKSGITIKAANERRAWLKGDGSGTLVHLVGCSNISFQGIRFSSADNNINLAERYIKVENSNGISFIRILCSNPNTYRNESIVELETCNSCLVEESEFYWFHRHAINSKWGNGNVFRRNYSNSRNYSGNWSVGWGGATVSIYPGSNNIVENCIGEMTNSVFDLEASGSTVGNKSLGCISLNAGKTQVPYSGFYVRARGADSLHMPTNTLIKDCVSIGAVYGIYSRSSKSILVDGFTCVNSSLGGIAADHPSTEDPGDGIYSFNSQNVLLANNSTYGIWMVNIGTNWLNDYVNAYGQSTNFNPSGDPKYTHPSSVSPNLGSAIIWIPSSSTMKGKGKNGADIGANIIYRYQNGSLTNQPLWNADGSFPHGAIVSGINDLSGSASNVHQRLGSIPVLSNAPATTPITTPSNLIVVTTTPTQPLPPAQQQPPVQTITPGTPAGTTSPVSKTVIIGAAAALLLVLASD